MPATNPPWPRRLLNVATLLSDGRVEVGRSSLPDVYGCGCRESDLYEGPHRAEVAACGRGQNEGIAAGRRELTLTVSERPRLPTDLVD